MQSSAQKSAFLSAQWRYLLMANYAVDPNVLKPHVPRGTELDFYEGKTYASIVGFRFLDTRVLGIPIPFHQNFTEVNLRFYVRYKTNEGWRRGTSFISEIVPRPAIAWLANLVYHEHYAYAPTRYQILSEAQELNITYEWTKSGHNFIQAKAKTVVQPMAEGSIEEFIAEHYWGYNTYSPEVTMEYGVEHPSWSYYPVTDFQSNYQIEALYGSAFVPYLRREPDSVFVADGSEVIVRKGTKISLNT